MLCSVGDFLFVFFLNSRAQIIIIGRFGGPEKGL